MSSFQAIVLSLIEGATEFLPISSTGHLILASKLLGVSQTEFVKSFEIVIQLGAILAVVFLYFRTLTKRFDYWKKILIAFLPTGALGLVFYKIVKIYLLGNLNVVICSLFLGGVAMLILENLFAKKKLTKTTNKLSSNSYLLIGLWQSLAMIPGVSRALATIYAGLGEGLTREAATEFSFLLAIPTMAAATGLDLLKSSFQFTPGEFWLLLAGFFGAFISALLTVKALINFVKKHDFRSFAWYRIILAVVFRYIFR